MHPLNKLRLAAGIVVDPLLEVTIRPLDEARKVPLRRSELKNKDQKSLSGKLSGLNSAIKHIQNAIKALDKIPATDFGGDIPNAIAELEAVIEGDSGDSGLIHLLDSYDKDHKSQVKTDKKAAKVQAEEEEAADFHDCMNLDESMWDITVKHPLTNGFRIQADTRDEAEAKATTRLANMKGGAGKILSVKMNSNTATSDEARMSNKLEKMDDKEKAALIKKADQKQNSGGSVSPLEKFVLDSSQYKKTSKATSTDKDKDDESTNESMHYYVDNQYTNYEDDEDKPVNVTDGSSNDEQVWDKNNEDNNDESPSQLQTKQDDMGEKMNIPANIKNQLRAEIDQARKEAKRLDVSNKDAANFYNDLASAFEDLLNHLEPGTIYDFKKAQMFAQTLMGPMLHKIPTDVWKFLANGGKTRSLKSYMQEVK